ncbi:MULTISPECIES: tetraacyldisaccharide 4'-kinase [Bombella]|uniref:Tetraacyldisaccharide 4'-kinase n=1 Tax=Bombella pollinis TaxID=2967337 RepID=A0ABT3WNE8_9PROT|nr:MULTISPECIES: tetraacyldisaccharide 4'-kinase [Bombella]MCX5619277.1 tetraacyldisaccharide 4'-kinase [Bombella pollinis]MUG04751.1 tetraacyldisaccharide 4'-kinase [Bombella sp. ESL0378]MUG90293.1 tetraacyldisaccharide 4'-kinase [Bombella sp. ESL0385]
MKLTAPSFWQGDKPSSLSNLLLPASKVTEALSHHRQKKPSLKVSVPVLCCGNISVGGTGKTPLALHILQKLIQRGHNPHVITRGYGGRSKKTGHIHPQHDKAIEVGDEAMLLAQLAPTWRGPDRYANAQQAIKAGADCLIMDDGLQDPTLHKDLAILTIDGPAGFGNQRLLPAGPLRETLAEALPRLDAAVLFGEDTHNIAEQLPKSLPLLKGQLTPSPAIHQLKGRNIIAFAGIGRPEKFFTMLREANLTILRTLSFPNHHIYSERDLQHLAQLTHTPNTVLVTTEKDNVKLPSLFQQCITTIKIEPTWHNPALQEELLDRFMSC